MAKIYVASSWRNQYYAEVVDKLREAGHEVYDFRNPPQGTGGFHWYDVDPDYMEWNVDQYREGMKSPRAQQSPTTYRPLNGLTLASWSCLAAAALTPRQVGLREKERERLSISRKCRRLN